MRKFLALCALALAALPGAALASDSGLSGRELYQQRCRVCHGGTSRADIQLGPSLVGIVGMQAGTAPGGVHSREAMESGIVWDRESLRGFLSVPRSVLPNSLMPAGVEDHEELERLLDFLETLR